MGYRRDYNAKIKGLTRLLNEFGTSALKPDAYLEMSEAYLRLGRNSDAIETYRRLIEEFPATEQGRQGHVQMAMTLLNTGDNGAAADAFREVVRRYPTSDEALVAVEELQRLAAREGNLGEVAAFLAGIENAPQLDVTETDRLSFQVAEEEYINNGSTARLERYLSDFPAGAHRPVAIGYMMDEAVAKGLTGDALTYANLIITEYPDSRRAEDALAVKATSEHALGNGAAALAAWQKLAARASTPAMQNRARAGIMRVARDMGDYALVIESADALLASSTAGAEDRNEAIFSRGLAHSLAGDNDAARADWSLIATLTDDINGVKSAYYLAQNLFDSDSPEAARGHVDAIIASGTPHTYWLARAFILLSDIFVAADNRFEAREYLRSLRENYPGTENDIFLMIDTRLNSLQ
ncbi:MAG: tetratricopeptide repeat protein [Muribaculaceae bacterium]|nr:tetratricopeptide repeat protein [Muribaculaceae bacterium]